MRQQILLLLISAILARAQSDLECPFKGGQDESSEVECTKYTACQWDTACSMKENGVIGYTVASDKEPTATGFKVQLNRISSGGTLYNGDVENLVFEAIYHEEYHLQIKITDADTDRYEVPVPLNFYDSVNESTIEMSVTVPAKDQPFSFDVTRKSTNTKMFSTYGALTYEDQFIQFTTLLPSTYLYGFGENSHSSLLHQFSPRSTYPIFARDKAIGSGSEYLNYYGHHPYYQVVEDDDGNTHSVLFFNSNAMEYSTFMTAGAQGALTLRTIGGVIDLHFFSGPTPDDVTSQYTSMVGSGQHPPYWFFGFQLSRWGYESPDHIREVRERTKAAGIPQDVQTIDIDYMYRYRDFTYDSETWADLPQLIDELHADNVKVILILDPGIAIDWDNYPPAANGKAVDAFVKWPSDLVPADQLDGASDYVVGKVWPDTQTVFPDFLKNETADWWKTEISTMHATLSFDALWIDMNEPANFDTDMDQPWSLKCPDNSNLLESPPYPTMMVRVGGSESGRISDHSLCMSSIQTDGVKTYSMYDTHSLYGWSESRATYNALSELLGSRSMVLSRSTFPGSGQYAVHWLGDNTASWDHMRLSIIGMIEFNMFGIPMVGADICGFFGTPSEELCARWMQLGAFYPFSRNHNENSTPDQDPAAISTTVADIARQALELRYTYLPYMYGLFHFAQMHGEAVIRPLYYQFPTDLEARKIDDQFMWSDGIMVAPVLEEGALSRDVYFPQNLWYDLQTGVLVSYVSGYETVNAPLDKIPVFVRGGSILGTQAPGQTTVESRTHPMGLTVALDAEGNASGRLFWDDGVSDHGPDTSYMSTITFSDGVLETSIKHGEEVVIGLYFETITFFGIFSAPDFVFVNGQSSSFTHYSSTGVLIVEPGPLAPLATALTITIA